MTSVLVSLAAVIAVVLGQAATPAKATYVYNLYQSRAVRFQNPELTACTAAATMTMLNLVYYTAHEPRSSKSAVQATQPDLVWKPSVSPKTQSTIFRYARSHMTMPTGKPGSDVHGFRNALNNYGWGSMNRVVYRDYAYKTYDQAVRATVREIALSNEPVAALSEYGGHILVVSGYSVTGSDPRTGSTNFTVNGVYITDSLRERHVADTYVTYAYWKSGPPLIQFYPFLQRDSTIKDPIDGWIGAQEWRKKYVIVAPVLPSQPT